MSTLNITAALTAISTATQELQGLLATQPTAPQVEALQDALEALQQAARDVEDARLPEGAHAGDLDQCPACGTEYPLGHDPRACQVCGHEFAAL